MMKTRKTMIRVRPEIAHVLGIVAKMEGVYNYEVAERILSESLQHHYPTIWDKYAAGCNTFSPDSHPGRRVDDE